MTTPTIDDLGEPEGYNTISLLTDYGYADAYVGILHSIIAQISPDARVIDLTHDIPPFDVRAGSLALARCVQYVAPGVIVAIVDPGVGTERMPIAVEVAGGKAVLVGPDNGVLAGAVAMIGGVERAFRLDNPEYQLATGSTTFDGRDIFAPIAAHLCNGVPLETLGTPIDPHALTPGIMPLSRLEDGDLVCESLAIDRFGNVQLNVDPSEVDSFGPAVSVDVGGSIRTAFRVKSFAEVGPGRVGLLVDSDGLMSLVCQSASAADELSIGPAVEVRLRSPEASDVAATSVELGARPSTTNGQSEAEKGESDA